MASCDMARTVIAELRFGALLQDYGRRVTEMGLEPASIATWQELWRVVAPEGQAAALES